MGLCFRVGRGFNVREFSGIERGLVIVVVGLKYRCVYEVVFC